MEADLQRRIQRYGWDKAAMYYERFWQRQLKPAQDKMLELARLSTGEKVVDIACGSGLVSFRAAEQAGKNGFVLGNDISDGMIKLCREIVAEKKITNIAFERMDAENLAVSDNEYDVALCALGLMYVPDPLKALKEMCRVLKPGGRAVALVWGERGHCGWADIFEIVDRRVSSEVCPMFFNLGNKNMLEMNFDAAGFSKVSSEKMNVTLEYDSDDDACGAAFAGGPVALAYNKFSEEVKEEVHAEYIDSIRAYKNKNSYLVPGEFVIAKGIK
ncbi:MAG: class I SAM-dependent methyltransferase [Chitinophagales bacterium]